jgi:hypothetical protein
MRTNIPPQTELEATMVRLQTLTPGRWDFMLLNAEGRPYVESQVGTNPLGHGYSYCVC